MFNYQEQNNNFRGVNQITTCKKIPTINGLENTEESLIKGGIIHHEVRKELQQILKPGIKTSEIAECIEKHTKRLTENKGINNGIGFPASLAVSNCAAHYHPSDASDILPVIFA